MYLCRCALRVPCSNADTRTFPEPAPISLFPTSLPVMSDLSYHNKSKNTSKTYIYLFIYKCILI